MVLYNVTVILEEAAESEWLAWMQSVQIPGIMATDTFVSNRMLKVLDSPNEGVTYCIQFIAESEQNFRNYQSSFEARFSNAMTDNFANRFVSFNTLMEFVGHQ
ncbi:MAG: hypothetical protein K0S09_2114 [Sphingobacteriaceae bacterium]|jgi:hypothetical protein|nr:hypothetical protein [Sphingobacteriaceae bacterium]